MLALRNVTAGYGSGVVLHAVSMTISPGSICALIGANGAGKTTTLRCIVNQVPAVTGAIEFDGASIRTFRTDHLVGIGLSLVPEGRRVFDGLTVLENLRVGGFKCLDRKLLAVRLERMFDLFPRLWEKRHHKGTALSGGEQQMLAIGRSLMSQPRMLLLDEPCLGLAPKIVDQVFAIIERLRAEGTTILLVEQNARRALNIADMAYVLENGRIVVEGPASALLGDERLENTYLGKSA